jgi:hypothetical protein
VPPTIRLTPTGNETLAVTCGAGAGPEFVTLNPTMPVLPGGSAPTGLIRAASWEPGPAAAGGDEGGAGGGDDGVASDPVAPVPEVGCAGAGCRLAGWPGVPGRGWPAAGG